MLTRVRFLFVGLVILSGAVLGSCSGHDAPTRVPNAPPESWSYPDTLLPLAPSVRAERLARFLLLNPTVRAGMDPYGRPVEADSVAMPPEEPVGDSTAAVAIARDFLERNREFFYITGDLPAVQRAGRSPFGAWWVTFSLQSVQDVPVRGTSIGIGLVRSVFAVRGAHYPGVRLPARSRLSVEEVRARLAPNEMFYCWSMVEIYLRPTPGLMILPWLVDPLRPGMGLSYRYAYEFWYEDETGSPWKAWAVDAMTAEKIAITWMVLCRE